VVQGLVRPVYPVIIAGVYGDWYRGECDTDSQRLCGVCDVMAGHVGD